MARRDWVQATLICPQLRMKWVRAVRPFMSCRTIYRIYRASDMAMLYSPRPCGIVADRENKIIVGPTQPQPVGSWIYQWWTGPFQSLQVRNVGSKWLKTWLATWSILCSIAIAEVWSPEKGNWIYRIYMRTQFYRGYIPTTTHTFSNIVCIRFKSWIVRLRCLWYIVVLGIPLQVFLPKSVARNLILMYVVQPEVRKVLMMKS